MEMEGEFYGIPGADLVLFTSNLYVLMDLSLPMNTEQDSIATANWALDKKKINQLH